MPVQYEGSGDICISLGVSCVLIEYILLIIFVMSWLINGCNSVKGHHWSWNRQGQKCIKCIMKCDILLGIFFEDVHKSSWKIFQNFSLNIVGLPLTWNMQRQIKPLFVKEADSLSKFCSRKMEKKVNIYTGQIFKHLFWCFIDGKWFCLSCSLDAHMKTVNKEYMTSLWFSSVSKGITMHSCCADKQRIKGPMTNVNQFWSKLPYGYRLWVLIGICHWCSLVIFWQWWPWINVNVPEGPQQNQTEKHIQLIQVYNDESLVKLKDIPGLYQSCVLISWI